MSSDKNGKPAHFGKVVVGEKTNLEVFYCDTLNKKPVFYTNTPPTDINDKCQPAGRNVALPEGAAAPPAVCQPILHI